MRVIVTRPGHQAGKWVSALRNAGLDAVAMPLIEIAGPPDLDAVRSIWLRLQDFDALMFVSANAVEQFFKLRPEAAATLDPAGHDRLRFYVTGPGSVSALLRAGVPRSAIDAPPEAAAQFDSETLWQVVQTQLRAGWRVLIVRGNTSADAGEDASSSPRVAAGEGVGRDWFAARLLEQGVHVEFLVTYERRAPDLTANALALVQVAASDGTVWLFSSSEAVLNLTALAAGQSWSRARAVATHPRIAQAAREAGFGLVCEARPDLTVLLASIESLA